MAGGTGGHVFPGLAVAKQLQILGCSVNWLGTRKGIEAELIPSANIPIDYIQINGVRGKGVKGLILAPFKIISAIIQSITILRKLKPSCVLGMGGFVAGPGAIAAKLLGIPLVIHEQNAIPGTTNKILSKVANRVLAAFPDTFSKATNAIVVGNPVRSGFEKEVTEISNDRPMHLLVLGGSLGAKAINEILPQLIQSLHFEVELWHQTGRAHFELTKDIYGNNVMGAKIEPFINDMAKAYQWADIVICRSGAMTVSEVAVAGLPAIFIPYPHAIDDHQTANAQWMVRNNAAYLLPQSEMSIEKLSEILTEINANRDKLEKMKMNAKRMGIHNAAERVAQYCMELAL
jgi:UDP-N-acetylglucosamine--N-acetylmuramyl-(pentapeptide) pyrophosphoryl-undecaprenol N-acetylglucosamine transferase